MKFRRMLARTLFGLVATIALASSPLNALVFCDYHDSVCGQQPCMVCRYWTCYGVTEEGNLYQLSGVDTWRCQHNA